MSNEEQVTKLCPFIRESCVGEECVMHLDYECAIVHAAKSLYFIYEEGVRSKLNAHDDTG